MNKAQFFFILTLILFFSSCNKKEKNNRTVYTKHNEIAVIIDDELWNGEIGDTLRNKFAGPILGLPQEEPLFTINQYPVKLLEGFMSNNRNIILIKKESKSRFDLVENEFAKPQLVFHISGETVKELLDSIQANDSLIIDRIKSLEISKYQQELKNDTLLKNQKLKNKYRILLDIPAKYKLVLKTKNFLWFKKEITSGNLSLIVYQLPYTSIKQNNNAIKRIVKIRDSINGRFIRGAISNTKMVTESAFSPYFSKIEIAGRKTYETKGSWEMQNDYMNGPFINYCIFDDKNQRILVLEGFCYAPSKQKRDLMFELEAIIKSIQFLKPNKSGKSKLAN
ncbi:uncharacterized protein DUF4837 [Flavobacterium croceum DSM 17960]|uniref:Uncharacterized protein DUF4837 n=1 Tax=Flavobacterium croceum DSM 17960 TaxID=1121886 RepID=A0A2S4NBD5_9FLAO|nr:DUF4837 family protein [Flavobacterium croceum]POS02995.1 uncharacterized protein DUF4837 [Flavobacterium croceum DSM 17960]